MSYVIKVLIIGRNDAIESPIFDSREAAEEDLGVISGAKFQNQPVNLPWLRMYGSGVEAAYLKTARLGWVTTTSPTRSLRRMHACTQPC
jgi:hypothetical protein